MMPGFFTSEWFVPEPDNWHLKPNAPEDIRREFEEYMERDAEAEREGKIIN